MKNRLLSVCALILLLFPLCARAEEQPVIINLVEDASQDYRFEEGAPLLEIVFPRVISSDCAILRFEDQVMMIDSSTRSEKMNNRIQTACQTIGVDHIDVAYNSHPHNDHIDGSPTSTSRCPSGSSSPRSPAILTFTSSRSPITCTSMTFPSSAFTTAM